MLRILLPPSEGKSPEEGSANLSETHPEIAKDARTIRAMLEKLGRVERRKWYGVKDDEKADAAHALNMHATRSKGIPAVERYTGVVYQNIEYSTLSAKQRARSRVYIVSAYFGLIAGSVPIPNYKLPMNPKLARHWLPINAERMAGLARPKGDWLSLLSQAYARAIPGDSAAHVDFRVQGGRKAAGHFGKAVKGRFVRWLIENRIDALADIGEFDEDGYRFDGVNFVQD